MRCSALINEFIVSRRVIGCTPRTVEDYTYFLHRFLEWLLDFSEDSADCLTAELFDKYSLHLLGSGIKRVTVRTYLTHLRALYHWAVENEYISVNLSRLHLPKKHDTVIDTLSNTEINTLMSCFPDDTFLDVRNRLILMCMLDCGFRRSDVVNLKSCNVKDGYFILDGKGSKQRVVPYGDRLRGQLEAYMTYGPFAGHFFRDRDGSPITANAVKMMFQRLKVQTGIERLKPHLLRHTFATNYLYSGGNLEMLRLILGHTDIGTTQIYLHMADVKRLVTQKHLSYLDTLMKASEIL